MRLPGLVLIRGRAGAGSLLLALLLGGCDSSYRLASLSDSFGTSLRARPPEAPAALTPAPTSPVETAPLPPLAGQAPPPDAPLGLPNALPPGPGEAVAGLPPGTSLPIDPNLPPPVTPPVEPPKPRIPPRVAAVNPAADAPAPVPTRTGVTGNWTAREAAGGSCRVTLSSAPALDLYKASTSGCQSRELQRVSAWELRGDEVYLYEPGGGVAARLKQSGSQRFEGAAAKTGAPVSLTK